MTKVAFYARENLLVQVPEVWLTVGQPQMYVGRAHDVSTGGYPATVEPFICDSHSKTGRRLRKLVRRDKSLWPADVATAMACETEFTLIHYVDGAWIPNTFQTIASEQPSSPRKAGSKK